MPPESRPNEQTYSSNESSASAEAGAPNSDLSEEEKRAEEKKQRIWPNGDRSEEERRRIWGDLTVAWARAQKDARAKYPIDEGQFVASVVAVGSTFTLSGSVKARPSQHSSDVDEYVKSRVELPAGTKITITRIAKSDLYDSPDYKIVVLNLAGKRFEGWIAARLLADQAPELDFKSNLDKESDYYFALMKEYGEEVMQKFRLTEAQVFDISFEGHNKSWPK